jgi:hypothetical protein
MKTIIKYTCVLGIFFLWARPAISQEADSIGTVQTTDVNRQVCVHDPRIPRFVLIDNKGIFSLGIGAIL